MGNKESGGAGAPSRVAQTKGAGGEDHVVNTIQVQRDAVSNIEKRIQYLETRIAEEKKLAKQCLAAKGDKSGNQAKAKRHLLKARQYQTQVTRYDGMRTNLEAVQSTLEEVKIAGTTTKALAQGNRTLAQAKQDMNIDKVEDLIDEIQENKQSLEEAAGLISQPIGMDPGLELDVTDELEELEKELADEKEEAAPVKTKKPAPKIPSLPEAPTGRVALPAEEEDDADLNALMQEMS